MALLKGKQIATGADGVDTNNIAPGALEASATGRAIIATSFFDGTATVADKFSASSIGLDRLEEAVIEADGGQAFTGDQSMGNNKLTNLASGTVASDAVNYGQLQAAVAGLSWKQAVRAATEGVLPTSTYDNGTAGVGATITGDSNGALSAQDDITLNADDRLLVKDQAAGLENGIYEVTQVGDAGNPFILTRVTDCDEDEEFEGAAVFVQDGTVNADTGFTQTADQVTVGATAFVWTEFTGAGAISFGSSLQSVTATTSNGAGSGTNAARDNHTHALSTAAQTVTIQSDAGTPTAGTAASVLRTDAQLTAATAAPGATQLGAAAGQGSSTDLARADHVHKANTAAGTIEPDDAAAIGTSQDFARADHQHAIATDEPVGLGSGNAEGSSTAFARADHVHVRDTVATEEITTQAITGTDTALTDELDVTPIAASRVRLYLNGMLQQQGAGNDYTVSGTAITWLASTGTAVDLETSDELLAVYDF